MSAPAPEVDFILSVIKDDWPGSETTLDDIPLERIDRDNADNIDNPSGWVHVVNEPPQEMNYVMAGTATRTDTPLGTEYDLRTDRVVSVRVIGVHVSEYGAIDPQGTANVDWPTTDWDTLTENVRLAVLQAANRTFPNVTGRSNVGFKDLFVENYNDQSTNFADFYQLDFDVRLSGFEDLPD